MKASNCTILITQDEFAPIMREDDSEHTDKDGAERIIMRRDKVKKTVKRREQKKGTKFSVNSFLFLIYQEDVHMFSAGQAAEECYCKKLKEGILYLTGANSSFSLQLGSLNFVAFRNSNRRN